MIRILVTFLLIFQMLTPLRAQHESTTTRKILAITHVTVIDATSAPACRDMTVIIANGRIATIGSSKRVRIPKGAQIIDATGKFLIPGLWDMHVHIGDEEFDRNSYLRLFIANGITGIRIMDGAPAHHLWRREVESGALLGPRMFIASGIIGFGESSNISPEQAREEVRKARQEGADFIKVHDNVLRESYFALVAEAKRLGLSVAGHVPISITAAEASRAGQRSIEHLTGLAPAETDSRLAGEWFTLFKKNHTWQCPTLIMRHNYALLNDVSFTSDPRLKYVKPSWRARWLRMTREAETWMTEEATRRRETIRREDSLVGQMQRAGIGILAGTDDGNPYVFPGFSLHDELALLVGAGLTPMQALQAATLNPAKFLNKLNSLGTVEEGKLADLVLLDANPLNDIRNTKKIDAVIVRGRFLDRRALDGMLAQVEASANQN